MDRRDDDSPIGSQPGAGSPQADDETLALGHASESRRSAGTPDSIGKVPHPRHARQGGMGVVYEAEQEMPKRRVALKVIRGGTFVDDNAVRMFKRRRTRSRGSSIPTSPASTGRAHRRRPALLRHGLVVGLGPDLYLDSRPSVIEGAELRFRLRLFAGDLRGGELRAPARRDPPRPEAVEHHRRQRGAERLGRAAEIKVLDFGLARITGSDVDAMTQVSGSASSGHASYMSPETGARELRRIDLRSDVYALGVILYEMLTGTRPYDLERVSIMESARVICEQPAACRSSAWKQGRAPDVDLETITGKAREGARPTLRERRR